MYAAPEGWHHYAQWANGRGLQAIPYDGDTFVAYIRYLQGVGFAADTIGRRLRSIALHYRRLGYPLPFQDSRVRTAIELLFEDAPARKPDDFFAELLGGIQAHRAA